ncbi:hypothetical protein N9B72_00205 [Bacteriovoracaceae bacterium]|nr:hypothetical protein [Bacteriovoracaceae bacterium]
MNNILIVILFLISNFALALPEPAGGILTNIESPQAGSVLSEILQKTKHFKDRYVYIHCARSCNNYKIIITESLDPDSRFLERNTDAVDFVQSSGAMYSQEVLNNIKWPFHESKLVWKLFGVPNTIIQPFYTAIGRAIRKNKSKEIIKFLFSTKDKGKYLKLTESAFETNYKAGRFKSQLFNFLVKGYVPGMFNKFKKKENRLKLIGNDILDSKICGLNTKFKREKRKSKAETTKYCLTMLESTKEIDDEAVPILLVAGFTQNSLLFDIYPENGTSYLRYLEKKFPVKVFTLNTRGVMGSDYIANSSMDDIAIDDISMGVNFIFKRYKKKVIIIGHSQGAISSTAYLSGLTRCGKKNCFKEAIALERSRKVLSIGNIGGNSEFKIPKDKVKSIKTISRLGRFLFPLLKMIKGINVSTLIDSFTPLKKDKKHFLAQGSLFSFLYTLPATYPHLPQISEEVRRRLYSRTLDFTSNSIIQQFAQAVIKSNKKASKRNHGIRSSSKEFYVDYIKNIKIPYYLLTFSDDMLANPKLTMNSILPRLNTTSGESHISERGHEDIFLHQKFHSDSDEMLSFLIRK